MSHHKLFLAIILLCLFSVPASASALAFQIIQHDSAVEEVRASSDVVEGILFDFFFSKGFIVTNAPTALSADSYEDKQVIYNSLDEARAGRCTYFVAIIIDYSVKASPNPSSLLLSNIRRMEWHVYDARTGKRLYATSRSVGEVSARRNNERGLAAVSTEMATDIYRNLGNDW